MYMHAEVKGQPGVQLLGFQVVLTTTFLFHLVIFDILRQDLSEQLRWASAS